MRLRVDSSLHPGPCPLYSSPPLYILLSRTQAIDLYNRKTGQHKWLIVRGRGTENKIHEDHRYRLCGG